MIQSDLRGAKFFESLSDKELAEFLEGSEPAAFGAGEAIIEEGKEPEYMFVLTSGRVEVRKRIPGGERVLAQMDASSEPTVVGERGLLGRSGASASVAAVSRVEAVKISKEAFRRMISDGRPAAFKVSCRIARTLAHRLTRLDEEVAETIRELERRGDADIEAFRDRLVTDWAI